MKQDLNTKTQIKVFKDIVFTVTNNTEKAYELANNYIEKNKTIKDYEVVGYDVYDELTHILIKVVETEEDNNKELPKLKEFRDIVTEEYIPEYEGTLYELIEAEEELNDYLLEKENKDIEVVGFNVKDGNRILIKEL